MVIAAQGNRGEHIFFVARDYYADWNLAVVGAIGGVKGAAAGVEADFSAKVAAEGSFKRSGIELRGARRGWGDGLRHKAQTIFVDGGVRRKGIAKACTTVCVLARMSLRAPRSTRSQWPS